MARPTLPKPENVLRLVSYNILNGGLGRADPLVETLGWLDGDIVGLVEADEVDLVNYFAGKLGYHSAVAEGDRHTVALLARWPIRSAINLKIPCPSLDRTAMEAIVQTPGRPTRLLLVHLSAGIRLAAEQRRLEELRALDRFIEPADPPAVLMGDFNANADYHPTDPAAAREKTRRQLAKQAGRIPTEVIACLGARGWIDALHRCRPHAACHTLCTAYPAQRVDYIFTDPATADRLLDAGVETGGFAPYCSDHFPIWVDLANFRR